MIYCVYSKADQKLMTTPQCVVMVVNGETLIQGLIKDALVLLGYDIIAADSGDAALPIVASRVAIDVIVNDSVMPGETNGFDLIV